MSEPSRSVSISVGLYRLLIKAYPASFRRAYGTEMLQVFCDLASDAWRKNGDAGLAAVWLRIVPDLASSLVLQVFSETHRRSVMLWTSLGSARFVVALAAALLIAALATPADPLSQLALGLPLYGVYLCVLVSRPLPRPARYSAVLISTLPPAFLFGLMQIPQLLEPMGMAPKGRLTPVVIVGSLIVAWLITALTVGATFMAARTWRRTGASAGLSETLNVD